MPNSVTACEKTLASLLRSNVSRLLSYKQVSYRSHGFELSISGLYLKMVSSIVRRRYQGGSEDGTLGVVFSVPNSGTACEKTLASLLRSNVSQDPDGPMLS